MKKKIVVKIGEYEHDVRIFGKKEEDQLILVVHGGPRCL